MRRRAPDCLLHPGSPLVLAVDYDEPRCATCRFAPPGTPPPEDPAQAERKRIERARLDHLKAEGWR